MRPVVMALVLMVVLASASSALADGLQYGTVTVTVKDETGAPVPYADIVTELGIAVYDTGTVEHAPADANGQQMFPYPANIGPTVMWADYHYLYVGRGPAFVVGPGQSVSYVIVLPFSLAALSQPSPTPSPPTAGPARGWITGVATLQGSGVPVAGATVAIAATPLQSVTGADGRYQFPGISTTDGQNGGPTYVVTITPPSGAIVAGPATQTVTIQAGQGAEADFVVKPAFTPFWVESFVPVTTEWSGSGAGAIPFGNRGQWSRFLVVAPQQAGRLYVHDPTTQNDAWIDAGGVGPSGPPPGSP